MADDFAFCNFSSPALISKPRKSRRLLETWLAHILQVILGNNHCREKNYARLDAFFTGDEPQKPNRLIKL
jgi:hypothetical protein